MRLYTLLFIFSISFGANSQTEALDKLNELCNQADPVKAQEQLIIVEQDSKNRTYAKYWELKGIVMLLEILDVENAGADNSKLLIVKDNFAKAIDMDKASEESISDFVAQLSIGMSMRAGDYVNKKSYESAINLYKINISISEFTTASDSTDQYNLGITYDKNDEIEKAKKQFQFCIDKDYYGGNCYGILIEYLEKEGKQEEAELLTDKAFKAYPNDQSLLLRMINRAITAQDYAMCVELCERALVNDPNNSNILYTLGTIYTEKGDFELADNYLTRAFKANPNSFDVCYNLGATHMNRAIELKNEANLLTFGDPKYDVLMDEAMVHFRKASPPMEQAHKLKPENELVARSVIKLRTLIKRDDMSKVPAPLSAKEQKKADKAKKKAEKKANKEKN